MAASSSAPTTAVATTRRLVQRIFSRRMWGQMRCGREPRRPGRGSRRPFGDGASDGMGITVRRAPTDLRTAWVGTWLVGLRPRRYGRMALMWSGVGFDRCTAQPGADVLDGRAGLGWPA